jgi:hypothetical protein
MRTSGSGFLTLYDIEIFIYRIKSDSVKCNLHILIVEDKKYMVTRLGVTSTRNTKIWVIKIKC